MERSGSDQGAFREPSWSPPGSLRQASGRPYGGLLDASGSGLGAPWESPEASREPSGARPSEALRKSFGSRDGLTASRGALRQASLTRQATEASLEVSTKAYASTVPLTFHRGPGMGARDAAIPPPEEAGGAPPRRSATALFRTAWVTSSAVCAPGRGVAPKWLPKWAQNGPPNGPKTGPQGSQTGSPGGPGGELRVRSVLYPLPGPLGGLLGPDWGDLGGVLGGSGGPFGALGSFFFEAHF